VQRMRTQGSTQINPTGEEEAPAGVCGWVASKPERRRVTVRGIEEQQVRSISVPHPQPWMPSEWTLAVVRWTRFFEPADKADMGAVHQRSTRQPSSEEPVDRRSPPWNTRPALAKRWNSTPAAMPGKDPTPCEGPDSFSKTLTNVNPFSLPVNTFGFEPRPKRQWLPAARHGR
jgi:hypothetical protein